MTPKDGSERIATQTIVKEKEENGNANANSAKKVNKRGKNKPPKIEDILKWEIAEELGLAQKAKEEGWGALTAAQSGQIGGMVANRKRLLAREEP